MTMLQRISLETAQTGTVVSRCGRDVTVQCDGGLAVARGALSCLVQPEPGDQVLLVAAGDALWLTAVLDRTSAAPMRLVAEGDLVIASATGSLSLAAAADVGIDAGGQARVTAPRFALHAGLAHLVMDEVLHVGRRLTAHAARIRVVGELLETVAEHVLLRTRRSNRFVAESDQARCGDIDHRATGTLQLQADSAFVSAETLVRIDAAQIHMG